MIRLFIILLLLSHPTFGAEQYAEPTCIILKKQIVDYESRLGRASPLYVKSKVNFDTHCKNPTVSTLKKNTVLTNPGTKPSPKPTFTKQKPQTRTKIKPIAPYTKQVPKTAVLPEVTLLNIIWPFLKMLMILLVTFSAFIVLRYFVTKKLSGAKRNKKPISRTNKSSPANSDYSYGPSSIRRSTMSAASSKGLVGEMEVNQGLSEKLDKSLYTLHSNITLPLEDGGTTQVDHIVLSDFGIFVIETKNMTGWIFGKEKQKNWTQVINRNKHSFQNPLRQNYKHSKTLSYLLDLPHKYFHSIVVFTSKAELKTRMPVNVGHLNGMLDYILSFNQEMDLDISQEEIHKLIRRIQLSVGEDTDRYHVDYLNDQHNKKD